MLEQAQTVQPELIASALMWWEEAGVDALVDEAPRAWLSPKSSPELHKSSPERAPLGGLPGASQPASWGRRSLTEGPAGEIDDPSKSEKSTPGPSVALRAPPPRSGEDLVQCAPKDLSEFLRWLAVDPVAPEAGPPAQRVTPSGDRKASIMVLIDMPEPGDAQAGKLLSGEAGDLFEKMLGAVKLTRETIWLASLSPSRPPGGQLGPDALAQLLPIARHHIDLIGPKRLWLMGQTVSRAFLGADAMPGTGCLRKINHEGRTLEAVASFSPRFLLQQPKRKAAAWADMQALVEGI